MTKAKAKDLQQKIKKNTVKESSSKIVKMTAAPTITKANKAVAVHLESKNKNHVYVVQVPNNVNKEEIAETVKKAIDSGGVLVLPDQASIFTIALK